MKMKIRIKNFKYILCIYIILLTSFFKSVVLADDIINQKDISFSLTKRKILYSKTRILEKSNNSLQDNSKKETNNSFNINILNYIKQENQKDTINGK